MKKAFTLIELLIVIAILGILAVGILVALDPVEQTKRAQDSTIQHSAVEIKDAVNRFYAGKLYYPWCSSASSAGTCTTLGAGGCTAADFSSKLDDGTAATVCGETVLSTLVSNGELKTTLPTNITTVLNLTTSGTGMTFNLSWTPLSKSFKSYYVPTAGQAGVYTTTACSALGTASNCPVSMSPYTCLYCIL